MKRIRVAVTGAAGQIGYSLLFRLASGEAFGPETEIELSLIELTEAITAAQGVVMELQDCAFPLLKKICVTADLKEGFKNVDWALLVGSVPRKAGMERGDLLKINGNVFVEQGTAINECASRDCKVLVVGNPCNTNALIAKAMCPDIPKENFFALTMLDQNRAAAQLALKAGADVSEISQIAIWGNHSATQYPDFYHAKIKGLPATEVITDTAWLQTTFIETVQKRGAEIIQARGKSSAASAANAVVETIQKLTTPTLPGEMFSVAVCADGSYGIEPGLMFSFPVRADGQRWKIVRDIAFNEFAKQKIQATQEELLKERDVVKSMLSL